MNTERKERDAGNPSNPVAQGENIKITVRNRRTKELFSFKTEVGAFNTISLGVMEVPVSEAAFWLDQLQYDLLGIEVEE